MFMSDNSLVLSFPLTIEEKRVVEHMAKKMQPSREVFEELGFSFVDIIGDRVLCSATLPEGWKLQATEHEMWTDIIDSDGFKRGSMFFKSDVFDRDAHMYLIPRYRVCCDYIYNDDYSTSLVYFGNEKEKLFIAGEVKISNDSSSEVRYAKYQEKDNLLNLAKQFGNLNYPNWKDVLAYWDDVVEKEQGCSAK